MLILSLQVSGSPSEDSHLGGLNLLLRIIYYSFYKLSIKLIT